MLSTAQLCFCTWVNSNSTGVALPKIDTVNFINANDVIASQYSLTAGDILKNPSTVSLELINAGSNFEGQTIYEAEEISIKSTGSNVVLASNWFNNEKITIFSGYDCDSLAYDSYTGFVEQAITFFGKQKNIELELRTKSTLVKPLMKKLEDNVVVAFSFTPSRFSNVYEKGVPSVDKRIKSLKNLVKLGWKIGLRFDPFIIYEGWKKDYIELFSNLFKVIPNQLVHSVTYGNLRYPIAQFKKIYRQNPTEKLFFNLKKNNSLYEDDHRKKISNFCMQELSKYVSQNIIFQNF